MELLRDIGRIRDSVDEVLDVLSEHGVSIAPGDLHEVGDEARTLAWTRDPFDRLIVAHAAASRAKLLTADETIREHFPHARWSD